LPKEGCYGTNEQKNQLTQFKWSDMPGVITKNHLFRYLKIKDRDDILHITDVCNKLNCLYRETDELMSCREILQFFGTNIVRKIYGDAWVNATINDILREKPSISLVVDVRFVNEVKSIQKAGGRVIKLTRTIDNDDHISEKEISEYEGFDLILDNSNLSISEQNRQLFDVLVNDWKWLDYADAKIEP
jgi:hypothetical protein